jgi:lipopolysaccharide/colanic/teichoic acid biosynthesis glycosyltransferase/glycosyltransferase involved in cell wall biosynthesis
MMIAGIDVFMIALLTIALVTPYVIYPFIVRYLVRPVEPSPTNAPPERPMVSVLIPAHNEAAQLGDKLRNTLALRYPREKLEILVASDGSDDDTADVARAFEKAGVRVFELTTRGGKLAALQHLLAQAEGDLVLFTDVGTTLPSHTLAELVVDLASPDVVAAMPRYASIDNDGPAAAESAYWNRETRLKEQEAERDMLLAAHGACYLMARDAIVEIPEDTIHDDFLWPLLARSKGGRIVYRTDLVISDEPPRHMSTIVERTARMAQGNLQILWRHRGLLSPHRGRIAMSLVGHKLMKTLGPVWILGLALWVNYRAFDAPLLRPLAIGGDLLLLLLVGATIWRASGRPVGRILGVGVHAFIAQAACGLGILRFFLGSNATRWRRSPEHEVLPLHRPAVPPRTVRIAKRMVDIIGGSVGIVVALPLIPLIALAIRLNSPGPVFYRQERVAKSESGTVYHFLMWKFRTMRVDAEADGNPVWATEKDPRVTAVGAFLRKTRLDEIPQLFQVVSGRMTLVGPRPERPSISDQLAEQLPGYRDRLSACKPGITGWAQVHTGYDTSVESVREKLLYDFAYSAHLYGLRSYLAMETRVVVLTLAVVVYGKGAR